MHLTALKKETYFITILLYNVGHWNSMEISARASVQSGYVERPKGPNVSTTPIMGCWQCLTLSVVQLKGKHCQKPHCHNGVVDMFRLGLIQEFMISTHKVISKKQNHLVASLPVQRLVI